MRKNTFLRLAGLVLAALFIPPFRTPLGYFLSFGFIGIIFIFMGILVLIRFIKKNPIPEEEMMNEY